MKQEELAANELYKELMAKAGAAGTFCPFRKEFQMEVIESLLADEWSNQSELEVLEACSGQGRLLYYLHQFDPRQKYMGIDYIPEHVAYANELFKDTQNISCTVGDIYQLPKSLEKHFDYTFLYKTLYMIPNVEQAIQELLQVTKRKIFITNPFYDGDIDFEIRIRQPQLHKDGQYIGYYIRSLSAFLATCERLGAKRVTVHDLKIPFDLPRPAHPGDLQTHTERLANGTRLEITGAIVLDWKLCVIDI